MNIYQIEEGIRDNDHQAQLNFLKLRRQESAEADYQTRIVYDRTYGAAIRRNITRACILALADHRHYSPEDEYRSVREEFFDEIQAQDTKAISRGENPDKFWLGQFKNGRSLREIAGYFARARIKVIYRI